jgi:hypothetical protein
MDSSSLSAILLLMAIGVFLLGMCAFVTGIIILAAKAWGHDVRTLSAQTTRLAQKGMAEDIAGLVGNASALLSALNDLVRTTTGIGVFLTTVGLLLMSSSFWMILQLR